MDEGLVQIIEAVKTEAEAKSEDILNEAGKEADKIIEEAGKDAKKLIEAAAREGESAKTEVMSQLRLAARDFILTLKDELEDVMALKPLRASVAGAMADKAVLERLLVAMAAEYGKSEGAASGGDISVTVPASMSDEFSAQLSAMFAESLKGGHPLLKASDRLEGFTFSVGGSGEVTVTPDAVVEALKPFVLKKFHELLEGVAREDA
ncbi:hypothetical protein ACFL1X_04270 [Candidatus Hydrogenedentota bacterium]